MSKFSRPIFDKNAFILLMTGSYGDIFQNLALLHAFNKKNQSQIIVLISTRWRTLTKRFNYPFLEYIFLNNDHLYQYSLMRKQNSFALVKGYPYPLLPTLHPHLVEAIFTSRISDYEVKKLLLGLSKEDEMHIPPPTLEKREELVALLRSKNCRPGQTLIIALERNSMPAMSHDLKIEIIQILAHALNLDILINESQIPSELMLFNRSSYKVETIKVPGDYPIEFIEAAGYYLGLSHGLSALLGTEECTAKMAIIVDITEDYVWNNGFLVPTREQNSILVGLREHVCKTNDLNEFFLNTNNINPTINNLINYFRGRQFNG
jgi:hypothetical protein